MKHTPKAIVRESKFRQLLVESRGAMDSYKDISPLDAASGAAGEGIAASATQVAYVTNMNEIQVIPIKNTKTAEGRAMLKGHANGAILDLNFSPLNYSLLASGGSDSSAKIWNCVEDGKAELKQTIEVGSVRAISQVRWHPTCSSLIGRLCVFVLF